MAKFCAKGHQMEDSWDTCPTCQTTGYQVPAGAAGVVAKTRLESDSPKEAAGTGVASSGGGGRRTVLISEKRKAPVVGWFVAMSGDQKGEDFKVHEGKNTVGCGPEAQISLKDSTISGQHASVRYEDGKFLLTDLDSSNGTYVNDRKIVREEIKDNDMIRFGEVIVKFKRL
ncbi:MAG: FHA domain-containing protein [Candidatus Acidiferrales bacterium]